MPGIDGASRTDEAATANPWLVLISVALGLFMAVIDVSILNIALPSIADELDASMGSLQWTLIAYSLALTGFVPLFGRISDVLGRKRLFIGGVMVFSLSSLLAGLSPSVAWLIAARVLQAVGGALITTNTLAIITDTFPPGRRGVAMGVQTILISGGAAVGPSLGGFLVTTFGWSAVFFVNLPIGLLTSVIAARVLPPLQSHRTLEPIDWIGAAALVGGLVPLLLAITTGSQWGWTSPVVLSSAAVGLVLLACFIARETSTPYPLVDLQLFRIRAFTVGQLAGVFASISMSGLMFVLPFYWQGLRGFSAQDAGLLMLPMPLTLMVVAPAAGRLSDAIGPRGLASLGLSGIALSLYLIASVNAFTPVLDVLWRLVVLGAGLGCFLAPNNNAVMSAVPAHKRGVSSGLLGTFRFIGQSLGVALSGAVFAGVLGGVGVGPEGLPSPDTLEAIRNPAELAAFQSQFALAMRTVCLATLPLTAIGVLASLFQGGKPTPTGGDMAERSAH